MGAFLNIKKSAVCGVDLAEPVCMPLLPDSCCCRHCCCCTAISCWAIARLCPRRCCCFCSLLLLVLLSLSPAHVPKVRGVCCRARLCRTRILLFCAKLHVFHAGSYRFLYITCIDRCLCGFSQNTLVLVFPGYTFFFLYFIAFFCV